MYIAPGHGHTTTWYKFWQHFKAFIISIICFISRKILFASLFYMILFCFYFIHVYTAQGQEETTLGDNYFMEAKRSYHFDRWKHVSKNIFKLSFYAHCFKILNMYIALAGADNPLGPKFWCQHKGLVTLVTCCKFKKNLFNLWLYIHLFRI